MNSSCCKGGVHCCGLAVGPAEFRHLGFEVCGAASSHSKVLCKVWLRCTRDISGHRRALTSTGTGITLSCVPLAKLQVLCVQRACTSMHRCRSSHGQRIPGTTYICPFMTLLCLSCCRCCALQAALHVKKWHKLALVVIDEQHKCVWQ